MNVNAMRKNSEATLARIAAAGKAKNFDEAQAWAAQEADARRCLELCDIYDAMTQEEKDRLAAIPTYKTDLREASDIRAKYGVSWKELETLRRMAWEVIA